MVNVVDVKDKKDLILEKLEKGFFGHDVRIVKVGDSDILYNGEEVSKVLEYKNPKNAYKKHTEDFQAVKLKESNFATIADGLNIASHGEIFVTEQGLYNLILDSKADVAKAFQHWVFSEMLPELRKTGEYNAPDKFDLLAVK